MRISEKAEDAQFTCLSAAYSQFHRFIPAGSISTITVGILPPARVLVEDLMKATLREGSPNLLKVASKYIGRKATSESTSSHGAGNQSGSKDNPALSSRMGVSATCSSAPGSSGSTAGGSSQGPNEPKQEVAHLTMVVLDDNEFTNDPHQIIPTEDVFTVPATPRENLKVFDKGYLLPAEVTAFQGIYYRESGDVRPGYTGASLFTPLWIVKDMWLQNSTQVLQPTPHTLGLYQQG